MGSKHAKHPIDITTLAVLNLCISDKKLRRYPSGLEISKHFVFCARCVYSS